MTDAEVLPVFVRLILSFLAAFPAIAVWSQSRNTAWMFVVFGTLLLFVDTIYATLVIIGVATYQLPWVQELPLLQSLLAGIPYVMLAIGFLIFLFQNRRY